MSVSPLIKTQKDKQYILLEFNMIISSNMLFPSVYNEVGVIWMGLLGFFFTVLKYGSTKHWSQTSWI